MGHAKASLPYAHPKFAGNPKTKPCPARHIDLAVKFAHNPSGFT
jgi:hypothetical protein